MEGKKFKMKKNKITTFIEKTVIGALFASLLFLTILSGIYAAMPTAPTITHISNETSSSMGVGTVRSGDEGGYITTLTLYASQQDTRWKAYVGNISGKFLLEDANGFSIYEWDMGLAAVGEVFISRNQTVNWATVNCSNRTTIESEDTFLSVPSTDGDSINATFNETSHKTFIVADRTMQNSTCPAISTFVGANETKQQNGENNVFQEILLQDNIGNLVYTTIMQDNYAGFDNNTYDFQAIVADDENTGVMTTYYFYVELGVA